MLIAGLLIMIAGAAMYLTVPLQVRRTRSRIAKATDNYFEEQRARRSYTWLSSSAGIATRALLLAAWGAVTCLVGIHQLGR